MAPEGMKFFFAIFWMIAAGTIVVPTQAQVNVTQEHNHISRDGLYIDSAFTRTAAANLRRDLNFNGTILGSVYAQPLYIENGPGGAAMIIVATETNRRVCAQRGHGQRDLAPQCRRACDFRSPLRQYQSTRHHRNTRRRSSVPVFVLRCDDRRRHDQTFNFFIERGHRRDTLRLAR